MKEFKRAPNLINRSVIFENCAAGKSSSDIVGSHFWLSGQLQRLSRDLQKKKSIFFIWRAVYLAEIAAGNLNSAQYCSYLSSVVSLITRAKTSVGAKFSAALQALADRETATEVES